MDSLVERVSVPATATDDAAGFAGDDVVATAVISGDGM